MEGINQICSLIISLYLMLVFLLSNFINKRRKKSIKYLVKLSDMNPTISFYSCNLFRTRKLFWISLLELVDNGYYSLKTIDNKLYIKSNNKSKKIIGYQLVLKKYIDNLLEQKEITIEQLDSIIRRDINFSSIVRTYMVELKKTTKKIIGDLDRVNDYVIATLCTFIYSLQVLFLIINDIDLSLKFLIAISFTYLTILFSDLLKNKIGILTKKNYLKFFLISIVFSVLATNIWNNNISNNYIIFHFVVGGFACMYPLLIIINVYLIRSNCKYKNKKQVELIEQINNLSDIDNYIYLKALNVKTCVTNDEIDSYFQILDL